MAETSKAKDRRQREGFFNKYCSGYGIDIGCGDDPVTFNCGRWDLSLGHGDATFMKGIPDQRYDFVYSSHCLEHIVDQEAALKNWWRILKRGGHLILFLPHRDYYEKRKQLPSLWNVDHKRFYLPLFDEAPHTTGVISLIRRVLNGYEFIYLKACNDGFTIIDPGRHSNGEYSIELVLKKI